MWSSRASIKQSQLKGSLQNYNTGRSRWRPLGLPPGCTAVSFAQTSIPQGKLSTTPQTLPQQLHLQLPHLCFHLCCSLPLKVMITSRIVVTTARVLSTQSSGSGYFPSTDFPENPPTQLYVPIMISFQGTPLHTCKDERTGTRMKLVEASQRDGRHGNMEQDQGGSPQMQMPFSLLPAVCPRV